MEISGNNLIPYEFRWIEEIGAHMIRNVEIFSSGIVLLVSENIYHV